MVCSVTVLEGGTFFKTNARLNSLHRPTPTHTNQHTEHNTQHINKVGCDIQCGYVTLGIGNGVTWTMVNNPSGRL